MVDQSPKSFFGLLTFLDLFVLYCSVADLTDLREILVKKFLLLCRIYKIPGFYIVLKWKLID